MRSDPEYSAEEVTPVEHYDPHFTEVSFRIMKGLVATAVIFADDPPTQAAFEREVRERMDIVLGEVTTANDPA